MKCILNGFHKTILLAVFTTSALFLCACPSESTTQKSSARSKSITEGNLRIYMSQSGKSGLVEAYLWDGTKDSLTIDVPDTTSEGAAITEFGGRIGIGVPDEFKIEFKPLDDSGFEPKYLPSLSKKLTPEMEEENEKLREEYVSDQWLYNRTAYYKGADEALYDGPISFEELEFTVNLGKNIEGIAVLDYDNERPEWAYLGIKQDDGSTIFYQPVYSFICDKDNKDYYSEDGKLYSRKTNEVLDLNYPDGEAAPSDYTEKTDAAMMEGETTGNTTGNDGKTSDMARSDDWTATEQLTDKKTMELTLPTRDAQPVKISFTENNNQGKSESRKGGVDLTYALAYPESDAPDAVKKIFDAYNSDINAAALSELKNAEERWDKYHETDADAMIYLSPKLGIQLMRSDTSILSYVTTNYCYNRNYEPDFDLFYGHTYDVQTGRELTLSDFVTDVEAFSEILCRQMALQSSGAEESVRQKLYLSEDFEKLVLESLYGCRNDGHFAWAVNSIGFEFFFSNPFFAEGYILNDKQQIFVPFSYCKEFLYQEVTAEYDYVVPISNSCLSEMVGATRPLTGEDTSKWHVPYMVRRDGNAYLYLSGNKETLTYDLSGGTPEYVGRVTGMINYPTYEIYEDVIDPLDMEMETSTVLVIELLQLKGRAEVGDDGQPMLKELYRLDGNNALPITAKKSFKAEAYSDENATKAKNKAIPEGAYMSFVRSDGETFIDVQEIYGDDDTIYRLYITGSYDEGFMINGEPAEELVSTELYLE